jgi:molybdate transport system regulatory protein
MPRKRTPAPDPSTLRIQIRVYGSLGPGRMDLLEQIDETGSIREAAQRMDMSYNRAWTLIRTTNDSFQRPLVTASRGGHQRGGAQLTDEGRQVLALFRRMERAAARAVARPWSELRRRKKR